MRMYNHFVQGNAELISIASDDSIWNSDSDNDDEDNSDPAGEKDEVDGEEEITNWNRVLGFIMKCSVAPPSKDHTVLHGFSTGKGEKLSYSQAETG